MSHRNPNHDDARYMKAQFMKRILKDKAEVAIVELSGMLGYIKHKIEKCEEDLRYTIIRCGDSKAHDLDLERVTIAYNHWSEMTKKSREIERAIKDIENNIYDGEYSIESGRCFDLLGYYVRLNHILNYKEEEKKKV